MRGIYAPGAAALGIATVSFLLMTNISVVRADQNPTGKEDPTDIRMHRDEIPHHMAQRLWWNLKCVPLELKSSMTLMIDSLISSANYYANTLASDEEQRADQDGHLAASLTHLAAELIAEIDAGKKEFPDISRKSADDDLKQAQDARDSAQRHRVAAQKWRDEATELRGDAKKLATIPVCPESKTVSRKTIDHHDVPKKQKHQDSTETTIGGPPRGYTGW